MSNPISNYLGVHAAALPLREQRMQLIASNLSNADTPNYVARDLRPLDFANILRAQQTLRPAATSANHIAPRTGFQPQEAEGEGGSIVRSGRCPDFRRRIRLSVKIAAIALSSLAPRA